MNMKMTLNLCSLKKLQVGEKYFVNTGASGHKTLRFYLDKSGTKHYLNMDEFI